ncbi:MAG: hypothetical protein MUF80_05370 [Burkholderiales bacterium]|nr:hypothetical protein [Burkholderiales bacterium]
MDSTLNLPAFPPSQGVSHAAIGLFVFAAAGSWRIQLVGTLPVFELALPALVVAAILTDRSAALRDRTALSVVAAAGAWFLAQVVSDIANETEPFDGVRGLANIGMFILTVVACHLAISTVRHGLPAIVLGLCAGTALQVFLQPDIYQQTDPWKFGLGHSATLAAALAVGHATSSRRWVGGCVLIAFAAAHVAFGSRALAGLCLLSGVTVLTLGSRSVAQRASLAGMAMLLAVFLVALIALRTGYEFVVDSGILPDEVREKFESQGASDLGLILSGRSELLVSTTAISERPWLGYGSWARDEGFAKELEWARLAQGHTIATARVEDDFIPSHSHVFGAWVQSGILGAAFWLYIAGLLAFVLWRLAPAASASGIAVVYLLYTLGWDILFSPMSLGSRTWSALAVAVLVSLTSAGLRRSPTVQGDRSFIAGHTQSKTRVH